MLHVYESKLAEKENIDPNAVNNLESKVVQIAEENIHLQVYIIFFVFYKILLLIMMVFLFRLN